MYIACMRVGMQYNPGHGISISIRVQYRSSTEAAESYVVKSEDYTRTLNSWSFEFDLTTACCG